jgi:hypothetical protein
MRLFLWLQNPKIRFIVAMGATISLGNILVQSLMTNLGTITGLVLGAAAIVVLAIWFNVVLAAFAKQQGVKAD